MIDARVDMAVVRMHIEDLVRRTGEPFWAVIEENLDPPPVLVHVYFERRNHVILWGPPPTRCIYALHPAELGLK